VVLAGAVVLAGLLDTPEEELDPLIIFGGWVNAEAKVPTLERSIIIVETGPPDTSNPSWVGITQGKIFRRRTDPINTINTIKKSPNGVNFTFENIFINYASKIVCKLLQYLIYT
jgi:hypothetical protein